MPDDAGNPTHHPRCERQPRRRERIGKRQCRRDPTSIPASDLYVSERLSGIAEIAAKPAHAGTAVHERLTGASKHHGNRCGCLGAVMNARFDASASIARRSPAVRNVSVEVDAMVASDRRPLH